MQQISEEDWRERTKTILDDLWYWLRDEDKRAEAAAQRNQNLVQVHRDGWKNTATAITKGLGAIADAIRDHGRR